MMLFEWARTNRAAPGVAMVFGSGLIGGPLSQSLRHQAPNVAAQRLNWDWDGRDPSCALHVEQVVQAKLRDTPDARLSVVWAAGRSGFGSDKAEMALELAALERVIETACKAGGELPLDQRSFHHVSSAGGLFEGQRTVHKDSVPTPLRAYGEGKLMQEQRIREAGMLGTRHIYRPSSVYGYSPGARLGLVSALISAALQNRMAKIVGAMATQRDYVLARDVGRFIVSQVLQARNHQSVGTHLLALGRPASIFEMIHVIEEQVGATVLRQIDPHPANALDNTFLPSALPVEFRPTSLAEGITFTIAAMKRKQYGGISR